MLARGKCAARSMEELRRAALGLLATGDAEAAIEPAGRAVALDPLDEGTQELFLRTLVAAGHPARAAVHLSSCEALFAREGLVCSPALRSAALPPAVASPVGLRAGVVATSLLQAGKAALDAGSADAGVETLRRAAEEAERARDPLLLADVLGALGSALVHAVRGFDGEGAVVLNRALVAALARRLYRDALRADLPEFTAWALIYQAEAGDLANLAPARTLAASIVNPELQARAAALERPTVGSR